MKLRRFSHFFIMVWAFLVLSVFSAAPGHGAAADLEQDHQDCAVCVLVRAHKGAVAILPTPITALALAQITSAPNYTLAPTHRLRRPAPARAPPPRSPPLSLI